MEYSFPPLLEGDPHACPAGWKYLPTLALPDGSHNFDEDTVFFHLPSLSDPKQTVYGISCFRQIPVEVCDLGNEMYIVQNKCRVLCMSDIRFETEGFTQADQIIICYMKFEVKYLLLCICCVPVSVMDSAT